MLQLIRTVVAAAATTPPVKKLLVAAACSCALTGPALAAVYNVNVAGGGVSAVGSITTDDTFGALATSNITDWHFDLNDGFNTFTLNGASNSQVLISGTGLSATASALSFDFSASGFALFQNPAIGSGQNFICFAGNNVCGGDSNRVSISVSNFGGGYSMSGIQQIASVSAVPEPESWAMLLAGFGVVGAMARRSRQGARRALA